MSSWINECTTKQSAWLYHKVDNDRGSDFARAIATELDVAETMEKEMVSIARAGW